MTITQPGSYRLTSYLNTTGRNTTIIEISANDGPLIEHTEAIGMAALDARRRVLRAEIVMTQQQPELARQTFAAALSSLDAIDVVPSHPLRAEIAQHPQILREP